MAIFTVTTTADRVSDIDGVLSLREAIEAARERHSAGADRIVFDHAAMGSDTIALTGGQLIVDSDLTIDGGGGITIDARQQSRVLLLKGGAPGNPNDLTLAHLTLTGGLASGRFEHGGGISTETNTSLALFGSAVRGNTVTGYQPGGGGIFAADDLTIVASTISGNSAPSDFSAGAGVLSYDRLVMVDSTVAENSSGNAMMARGIGVCSAGALELTHCTIAHNNAGFGFDSRGGGVYSTGTLAVANSIVAGNSILSNEDIHGAITASNGHNIIGTKVTGAAAGDQVGVYHTWIFDGRLADHGGPTQTIALRIAADNPALAAGAANTLTTDQRGYLRPAPTGSAPDIGAFEAQPIGAPKPFDGLEYIATYPDLIRALGPKAAFGNDTVAATVHYITYGFAEERTDQPLTASATDFLM